MKKQLTFKCNFGFLAVFLLFAVSTIQAAGTNYYFYVQFTNKNNTPYALSNPSAYLSQRAIDRRVARFAVIDSTDLPVNTTYLQQIESLSIRIHSKSKWLNGATVVLSDTTLIAQVRKLPCVKFVQYTGKIDGAFQVSANKKNLPATTEYGLATTQIDQLNGKFLHNLGCRGKNVMIGILDAGFTNVDVNPAFDSLRLDGRILGVKDIIDPTSNIFTKDSHGAMVLSTMGGNLPGQFLGTAPDASFWLIRSEYGPTENLMETDFWCSGIEFADSVGVDIVNSSLGYTLFDDASMNFSYADMTGKVARSSRAAELAAKKGIIVVCSAGNEATATWHFISSPADADGILTVGGITTSGTASTFSSFGPTPDLRVKPEVCALGTLASVVNTGGIPTYNNGTSFASPIMAGMMACLLQATKTQFNSFSIDSLLKTVVRTGSLYHNPDNQLGYGVPDFQLAYANLPYINALKNPTNANASIRYNHIDKTIYIKLLEGSKGSVKVFSLTGQVVFDQLIAESETRLSVHGLQPGMFVVLVNGNSSRGSYKIIVN